MKLSNVLVTCAWMAVAAHAVYPPVAADSSIADSELVTIQNVKGENIKVAATDEKKTSQYLDSLKKQAVKDSDGPVSEYDDQEKSTNAFFLSTSMIVVSEIGDKTFLVAALMAMKHPRMIVFSAAFCALALMTVLSGVVGHALPALIPQRLTQFFAASLFVIFGANLLREGLSMSKNAGVDEEMAEVEEEIETSNLNQRGSNLEAGAGPGAVSRGSVYKDVVSHVSNLAAFVLSPVWVQTFAMTFLGEWGDRSQIATIAMAAGSDYWLVILGGIVGHGLCTGMAVVGGQLLATKISMRTVTLGGSAAFFVFALMYFYNAYYDIES